MRLVTKCDIDGMACGTLLKEIGLVDEITFVHPRDVETGKVKITSNDITAGLPYRNEAHLAFDYYLGNAVDTAGKKNLIINKNMLSTSRVIYSHFGSEHFKRISVDLLNTVDKSISGRISSDEVLYPNGWMLLSFLIDQRTGLEKFGKFSIPDSELIIKLTDFCREHTVFEILNLPDVEERFHLYFSCIEQCKGQTLRCSSVHHNLLVIDMRNEQKIYPGNRFILYALFPECNVSLQVVLNPANNKVSCVVGKSILDRSFAMDIGKLMKQHGGGGHFNAGTCQTDMGEADKVINELIHELRYSLFQNLYYGYFNYYQYR